MQKGKTNGRGHRSLSKMWNNGYNLTPDRAETEENAIELNSDYITRFGELAKKQDIAIGVTFLEKHDPSPRNSFAVIDRHGKIVLHYAKVHTCVFDPTEWQLTAGDDFYTADLDTENGAVKIGAMICYDRNKCLLNKDE